MRIRLGTEMKELVAMHAEAAKLSVQKWAELVVRQYEAGTFLRVATPDDPRLATPREASSSLQLRGIDLPASTLRRVLLGAVDYCEEQRPAFRTEQREGVDYLVDRSAS